jgi:hypothetical protein
VEQIGRLKEKYGVGQYYEVEISQEKGKVIEVSLKKRDALGITAYPLESRYSKIKKKI